MIYPSDRVDPGVKTTLSTVIPPRQQAPLKVHSDMTYHLETSPQYTPIVDDHLEHPTL